MEPKISFPDCRYEQCREEWKQVRGMHAIIVTGIQYHNAPHPALAKSAGEGRRAASTRRDVPGGRRMRVKNGSEMRFMLLQVCDCYRENPLARFIGACNKASL